VIALTPASNYGLLGVMDRLHGTDSAFRKFVQARRQDPPFSYDVAAATAAVSRENLRSLVAA
jgi:hypothetical protein